MNDRADSLVRTLRLRPHPEGGHYHEVFRSAGSVVRGSDAAERAALTTIYYLLAAGQHSRWHRVLSDEVWNFYEGAPLELLHLDAECARLERLVLGPVAGDARPVHVIPAGHWQAARPLGDFTLAGCAVGPGFDFADFGMLADDAARAETVRTRFPELAPLL